MSTNSVTNVLSLTAESWGSKRESRNKAGRVSRSDHGNKFGLDLERQEATGGYLQSSE